MQRTHNQDPKKPNYAARQAVAAGAILVAAMGVVKSHDIWTDNQRHMQYVEDPSTIPKNESVPLTINAGDTAFDIAHHYAHDNVANAEALTDEIQNQADKGILHPGQSVVVERTLIDPAQLPVLLELGQETAQAASVSKH